MQETNPNESSRMKRLVSGNMDESIRSKLPASDFTVQRPSVVYRPPPVEPKSQPSRTLTQHKRVLTSAYIVFFQILIGIVIWNLARTNAPAEMFWSFVLPSLIAGYLLREILLSLFGDTTTDPPPPTPPSSPSSPVETPSQTAHTPQYRRLEDS